MNESSLFGVFFIVFTVKLNSSSLVAHNHEQLERTHSICLASRRRIITAIEFPLAAPELLCSPHIFLRGPSSGVWGMLPKKF